MGIRLGVNIDHVATLRQARGECYPKVREAAKICLQEGADQITLHLREDRRHIQDQDVREIRELTRQWNRPMNLEMGCDEGILQLALQERPEWICLVPEKREEKTTEGGLNLRDPLQYEKLKRISERVKEKGEEKIKISLFIEANEEILSLAHQLPVDAVEIHTGDYARSFLRNENLDSYWTEFEKIKRLCLQYSLGCHAGHGLTGESVKPLLQKGQFEEYNIGHWIICESLFLGLSQVIRQLKGQFNAYSRLS